jgi:hypothetical protein
MGAKQLHQHASIRLVIGDRESVVPITYHAEKKALEITLAGSGLFGFPGDMNMLVTGAMLERIVYLPDGTIQLKI